MRAMPINVQRCTVAALVLLGVALPVAAQRALENKLVDATEVLHAFTANDADSIPTELLERAHGIAIIPNVFRGGFILGGRRGRGVLVVRSDNGEWSNPAFITLTGGSIGWQIGAESADVVLVFANDRSVVNIANGKFTLGGDASAIAGPLGRHATMALTFRAEVYGYLRSSGLYAGAAFQGIRLSIDEDGNGRFYGDRGAALEAQSESTPAGARRFLLSLDQAMLATPASEAPASAPHEEAQTFPLD